MRVEMVDYLIRWAAIGGVAAVAAVSLIVFGVRFDAGSVLPALQGLGILLLIVVGLRLASRLVPVIGGRTGMAEDCLLSFAQLAVLLNAFLPVSYAAVAAGAGLPLWDDTLARLDLLLFGVEWERMARWVADRPLLELVLNRAYFSLPQQCALLLLAGTVLRPGERNSELLWLGIVSMCLTAFVSVFTPAEGKIGHVGLGYLEVFREIRAGTWVEFTYARAEGIVTFPSFHTTLAVLFTYAAWRLSPRLLVLFAPVNLVMLVSIPPIGGHYIVDLFGGAAVAVLSIALVRLARRATGIEPARTLAGRPVGATSAA